MTHFNFIKNFQGADATINFIRKFNNLFDIMNTRHKHFNNPNIYKRPISHLTKDEVLEFCKEMIQYISHLKLKPTGPFIVNTEVKCGFRGFIVDMKAVEQMYREYVEESPNSLMVSLPTFPFSQDFLELFFGKIRSMGGYNDNPNTVDFSAAYRKLLCHSKVMTSEMGNVSDMCAKAMETDILTVSSRSEPFLTTETEETVHKNLDKYRSFFEANVHEYIKSDQHSNELYEDNIAYAAYKIEMKLQKLEYVCEECVNIFNDNDKIVASPISKMEICQSTFDICKICDDVLEANKPQNIGPSINYKLVYLAIIEKIDVNKASFYPKSVFASNDHENHKEYFIRLIIDEYVNAKCVELAKEKSQELKASLLRHKLRKTIQFLGS